MSDKKSRFLNRELSWMEFNQRVLDEARNPANKLLERLKFLAISASNLDEFHMVRVGGLQLVLLQNRASPEPDPAGLSTQEQLLEISQRVHEFVECQYQSLQEIETALEQEGIRRKTFNSLAPDQATYLDQLFTHELYALMTPLAVVSKEDFPMVPGLGINILVRLFPEKKGRRDRYAVVAVPKSVQRLISLPTADEGLDYILVEEVIQAYLTRLFPGERIAESALFRVTRNADLEVQEDQAGDLLLKMQKVLQKRQASACVRLELGAHASPNLREFLDVGLEARAGDVYRIEGPLALGNFMSLTALPRYEGLRDERWEPQLDPSLKPGESILELLSKRDLMLFHPYDSFDPVLRLVSEAADDPQVQAIKQILYRTSRQSPVIAALIRAAEKGKQVTAIIELKARFDEARNIEGARALERAGAQVIYGIKNLKTHAKLCLIIRRESTGVRRYMHFGTGNYNEITARLYTDISYMTAREDLAADASLFFNTITGYSQPVQYRKIEAAPIGLRDRLLELIEAEMLRAREGQEALIMAKFNALVDPKLIDALYRASEAGVNIRLNVRGVCGLRPGETGLSDHIQVISIVDRFLEHGRILYFHHGGEPQVFITSADWMPRNLDRRIELLVPVEDPACRNRLIGILKTAWSDNVKARELQADGHYIQRQPPVKGERLRSQEYFYEEACQRTRLALLEQRQTFQPHRPTEGNG